MNRQELLCQIRAYGFSAYEIELFLDTHPNDEKALKTLSVFRQKYAELKAEYESLYGPMNETASATTANASRWKWIDTPWPWDYCADKEG